MGSDLDGMWHTAVLSRLPVGVLVVDSDARLRWMNDELLAIFGYEPGDLHEQLGRSVLDFIDPEWDPEATESIWTAMDTEGARQPMPFKGIRKDGSETIVEVQASADSSHPVIQGMILVVRPWNERHLLDLTLEAMAASHSLEHTLGLLVGVAQAETLQAAGVSILFDRLGDQFTSAVTSEGLAEVLRGPVLGLSSEATEAWRPLVNSPVGQVIDVADLPEPLRAPAMSSGFRTLWLWPSSEVPGATSHAAALVWRLQEHLDTDQTRRKGAARLARVAGLVVDRVRGEERSLTTVLFTDISGSTATAMRIGDSQWRKVLAAHDRAVRDCIGTHGGREIRHTGDGFLATFDSPTHAVRCALDAIESTESSGTTIRAGVHVGEVERPGSDLLGIGVHIGARIVDVAQPSEVLVSQTVRDTVVGSGLELLDRGEHSLKGVPGVWRLFRAQALSNEGDGDAPAET